MHDIYRRFRLHYCPPGCKHPNKTGWQTGPVQTPEEIEALIEQHGGGYCIKPSAGYYFIDVDSRNGGFESVALIEIETGIDLLEATGCLARTPGPEGTDARGGYHTLFSCPLELASNKSYPGVDIIGPSRHVMGPGSLHPERTDGKRYELLSEHPEIVELPAEVAELFRVEERQVAVGASNGQRIGSIFNQSADGVEFLAERMREVGYDVWTKDDYYAFYRPGKSRQSGNQWGHSGYLGAVSADGVYQLINWSTNDPYLPAMDRSVTIHQAYADICHEGDLTRATAALAEQGYTLDAAEEFLPVETVPASDVLPVSKSDFPGIISRIYDFIESASHIEQPEMWLMSSLAIQSVLCGHVRTSTDIRANLMVLAVSHTGSGKESAINGINRFLTAVSRPALGEGSISSAAGLIRSLHRHNPKLFAIDEVGSLIRSLNDPNTPSYLSALPQLLCELYSASHRPTFRPNCLAEDRRNVELAYPYLSLYGATVPTGLWQELRTRNLTEGLLGRIFVFPGRSDLRLLPGERVPSELEPDLIEACRLWVSLDLLGEPLTVTATRAAKRRFRSHQEQIVSRMGKDTETGRVLWSRVAVRSAKFALLRACSRATVPAETELSLDDIEVGIRLSNWGARYLEEQLGRHLADSTYERDRLRVLRIIRSAGSSGITRSELANRSHLRKRLRDEIIEDLRDSRSILLMKNSSGGVVYRGL